MRIYLDSNILKRNLTGTDQFIDTVSIVLKTIKENVVTFYSDAHLDDLKNVKNDDRLKVELNNIYEVCGTCFVSNTQGEHLEICIVSPYDAYQSRNYDMVDKYLANPDPIALFEELTKDFDQPEWIKNLLVSQLKLIHDFELPRLDISHLDPGTLKLIEQHMPGYSSMTKMGDLIHSATIQSGILSNDKEKLEKLRKLSKGNFDHNLYSYNKKGMDFNELLLNSPLKKTFDQVVNDVSGFPTSLNYVSKFRIANLLLDFLNIAPDKKGKKSNIWNITADGDHAFFGGLCDVFVTDDQGLYTRASIIYKLMDLPTRVIKTDNILGVIDELRLTELSADEFHTNLCKDLESKDAYLSFGSNEDVEYAIYNVSRSYWNYFNQLQYIRNNGKHGVVSLIKVASELSGMIVFYKEIELLFEQIQKTFAKGTPQVKFKQSDFELGKILLSCSTEIYDLSLSVQKSGGPLLIALTVDLNDKFNLSFE